MQGRMSGKDDSLKTDHRILFSSYKIKIQIVSKHKDATVRKIKKKKKEKLAKEWMNVSCSIVMQWNTIYAIKI